MNSKLKARDQEILEMHLVIIRTSLTHITLLILGRTPLIWLAKMELRWSKEQCIMIKGKVLCINTKTTQFQIKRRYLKQIMQFTTLINHKELWEIETWYILGKTISYLWQLNQMTVWSNLLKEEDQANPWPIICSKREWCMVIQTLVASAEE